MPIFTPGIRDRHNRTVNSKERNAIVMLSLTAMVDMFTVLAIFLLQNYNVTGQAIELEDAVELPKATETKELKPAHVVVVSKGNIMLDKDIVASFNDVKEQQDWLILPLQKKMVDAFKRSAEERKIKGLDQVKQVVDAAKNPDGVTPEEAAVLEDHRITIQADKQIDFLTIKKVMYTLKESGAGEINFAVLKTENNNGGAAATE